MTKTFSSLLLLGIIGVITGTATAAYLNDSVVIEDNTFQAGSVTLEIGFSTEYNDEVIDQQDPSGEPGTIFNFQDIKPGDSGVTTISTVVSGNNAWKWMLFDQTDGEGELAQNIEVDIFYDNQGDGVFNADDEMIYQGSLADVENELGDGYLLDGNLTTEEEQPFQPTEEHYISVQWQIPETVQNVDNDFKEFDLQFYAEQARHNPDPENPWE